MTPAPVFSEDQGIADGQFVCLPMPNYLAGLCIASTAIIREM
jgi:hypothetical protein